MLDYGYVYRLIDITKIMRFPLYYVGLDIIQNGFIDYAMEC